uniref:Apple domain-containing protein n=1 Tax=Clytia hemisphaerica TaxID=252671 RepID=A0A7M5XIC9_9CNID
MKSSRLQLLVFIIWTLLWQASSARDMWDPALRNHTSRVQQKHTALITTKTMRFKNIKAGCMMGSGTIRDVYETETGCAEVCMDEPRCITWNQLDQRCMIYDKVFRANPRKVLYYYGGD